MKKSANAGAVIRAIVTDKAPIASQASTRTTAVALLSLDIRGITPIWIPNNT